MHDSLGSPTLDNVFRHVERIVGRRIAGEYILVPLVGRGADLDAILNLNRVGTFIWERIDGRRAGSEIVAALVDHFEVDRATAERDYLGFLAKLLSVQAIEPAA